MNRPLAAIALSAAVIAHAAGAKPVSLQSVYAVKAQSPAAAVELSKADAAIHATAIYTGKQRAPDSNDSRLWGPLVSAWAADRKLGRYVERNFHENLLEFEDGGVRYSLVVAFPANQRVGRLKAGERVELLVQRIGFAYGQPVVVAFHAGTPAEIAAAAAQPARIAGPVRASVIPFNSGALRFEYAGGSHAPPMRRPDFNPSTLTMYPDHNLAELDLFYGDAAELTARLRLRGILQPGEYPGYADFDGALSLRGTRILLNPEVLRDCRLTIARIDALGAGGTLACQRAAAISELVPTRFEFSARP